MESLWCSKPSIQVGIGFTLRMSDNECVPCARFRSAHPCGSPSVSTNQMSIARQRISGPHPAILALQVVTIRTPAAISANIAVIYDVREVPWDQILVQVWPPSHGLADALGLEVLTERLSPATQ